MTATQMTKRTFTAKTPRRVLPCRGSQRGREVPRRENEEEKTIGSPSSSLLCVLCVFAVSVFLVVLTTACRSGPPPTPPAQAAARLQEAAGKYKDVVVVDAQCSSFANKDDQIVCIANKGKDPVKIGNWLIRNTIGRTFYFPAGTVIDGGKTLRVHTGAGTSSATDLYWNYEFKPVFDSKDQITLVDDSATDVAKFTTP